MHEALSHPSWKQAMVEEIATLHSTSTWDLVILPIGKSPVGCRWVYNVKFGPDSRVDRLKVCLVAKGIPRYMALITMTLFLMFLKWLPFISLIYSYYEILAHVSVGHQMPFSMAT